MTALPEVPEGHRWNVARTYGPSWGLINNHDGYRVSLEKAETKEEEFVVETPTPGFWKTLLYTFKDAPKPLTEIRTVHGFETVPGSVVKIHSTKLTPVDVSLAAKKSLKQVAERVLVDSLVGTYPPKNLVMQESDDKLVYTEEEMEEVKRQKYLEVIRNFMSSADYEGSSLAEYMSDYLARDGRPIEYDDDEDDRRIL